MLAGLALALPLGALPGGGSGVAAGAAAPLEGFLGEIRLFAGEFAPAGWALCNGQQLAIAQNTALFQILGTTYGGDGVMTFALPDLRGRVPLHAGQGAGLSARALGQQGGAETVALTVGQLPSHTHSLHAATGEGTSENPANRVLATSSRGDRQYAGAADTTLHPSAVGAAGGGKPHDNMSPFLGLNFIICVIGAFPSQ